MGGAACGDRNEVQATLHRLDSTGAAGLHPPLLIVLAAVGCQGDAGAPDRSYTCGAAAREAWENDQAGVAATASRLTQLSPHR